MQTYLTVQLTHRCQNRTRILTKMFNFFHFIPLSTQRLQAPTMVEGSLHMGVYRWGTNPGLQLSAWPQQITNTNKRRERIHRCMLLFFKTCYFLFGVCLLVGHLSLC